MFFILSILTCKIPKFWAKATNWGRPLLITSKKRLGYYYKSLLFFVLQGRRFIVWYWYQNKINYFWSMFTPGKHAFVVLFGGGYKMGKLASCSIQYSIQRHTLSSIFYHFSENKRKPKVFRVYLRFSEVFRVQQIGTLTRNGLK